MIFHIRENYLIKKHHHDVIYKILDNKINNELFNNLPNNRHYNYQNNMNNLLNIFYLFNKYFDIASSNTIRILYNYVGGISYYKQYNFINQFIQKYQNYYHDRFISSTIL